MKPIRVPGFDIAANYLNSRTVREKQMIFGFIIALAVALDFVVLVQPVAKTLFEQAPKLPPLRQELRELRQDMKMKDKIRKEWEDSKKSLAAEESVFVTADGAPALLEDLSREAQKT